MRDQALMENQNTCRTGIVSLTSSFYRAMHYSAMHGLAITCRLFVRLSVCLPVGDGGGP